MSNSYQSSPNHQLTTFPKGIKYIIGNEACERFSYYGMSAILYIYVVSLFINMQIENERSEELATAVVHFFKTGVYAMPMIGAIIADRLLGKYRTILWLSIIYCLGHLTLALAEHSISGLYLGLFLIALGSGGIKPCVSAHIGDQFGKANWRLIPMVYQIFYFSINFGSFFATLLIPLTQKWFGWQIAFGIPGILMAFATLVFWIGRNDFVHIPAKPAGKLGILDTFSSTFLFLTFGSLFFTAQWPLWVMALVSLACFLIGLKLFYIRQKILQDDGFLAVTSYLIAEWAKKLIYKMAFNQPQVQTVTSGGGGSYNGIIDFNNKPLKFSNNALEATYAVWRIMSVFIMVSIFWALFDQYGSSWIRQGEMMNLSFYLPLIGPFEIMPAQISAINPILVMILIPFMIYIMFPTIENMGFKVTSLRKMTAGMFIASLSFVGVAIIQTQLDSGVKLHVTWQLIPYILLTIAEVLVSITGLEFAYTQAPKKMKSTIMGFWLLTVSLGNVLVALLAQFSHLALVDFFWLFAVLMCIAAIIFGLRAQFYQIKDYTQE
jgi:proton-dependent oligopeptide transporter, POT family